VYWWMYVHYLLAVSVHSSNPHCWYTEDHILSYIILNRWQNNQILRENEWYYKSTHLKKEKGKKIVYIIIITIAVLFFHIHIIL
jgi:hypothetical protein